jgi:hypothetical protein
MAEKEMELIFSVAASFFADPRSLDPAFHSA